MSALLCEFSDKIRFYDEVLREDRGRLFVSTALDLPTGAEVRVSIRLGGQHAPFEVPGKVVAKVTRHGTGGAGRGLWVQLPPAQLRALRQMLSIDAAEVPYITARSHPRYPRQLSVHVRRPTVVNVRTRDVSAGGLCLEGPLNLPVGQTIYMTIDFDLEPVAVYAKVVWTRPGICGVSFRFQNPEVRRAVQDHVRRLAEEEHGVVSGRPTVMIVEDDAATAKAMRTTLEQSGYGVLLASNGPEALALARGQYPALILLDVLLRGMNGLEVCRVLKRDAGTSRIPVVLASSLQSEDLGALVKQAGALAALCKPYRMSHLTRLVANVLEQSRSLIGATAGPMADDERRHDRRSPMFVRAHYESETLHAQGYLRDASDGGGFFVSYWGEEPAGRGLLTVLDRFERPLQIEVEVRHRIDWGVDPEGTPDVLPGFGVRFLGGEGLNDFRRWVQQHCQEVADRPLILVVDDDRSHLEVLSVVLRYAGFAVVALDSPLAVANAVALSRPALVLLDFMMPGSDCRSLCEAIREAADDPGIPIWLHSSVGPEHFERLVRETGAAGWIDKGTRPTQVAARLAEALGMSTT